MPRENNQLPDGMDALNEFRNSWSTDHDPRRRKRLREFDTPDRRKRKPARWQPPVLAGIARQIGADK